MNIAVQIASSPWDKMERMPQGWYLRTRFKKLVPQFVPIEMATDLKLPVKIGDIVKCCTNPNHEWGISELVERNGYDHWKLRLIGGDNVLRMYNESFEVLRFIQQHFILTGLRWKIYRWCQKAFLLRYNDAADDYMTRFGGAIVDEQEATVWERPHIVAHEKQINGETKYVIPRKHVIAFNSKTKLRDIVMEMQAGGFGSDFEYGDEPPTEGMAGCATFKRDDLVRDLGLELKDSVN